MRQRTIIVLLLALASGGLAGYTALRLLQERSRPLMAAEAPRSSTQVVVAARDLAVGELVGEEDVKSVDWPSNTVPEGYARTIPDVVGRGLITSVRLNEPLLETKMADRNGQGGLPIVIPEGMRAVSVRVDEVVAVAGFVTPGKRVDVLLSIQPPGGGDPITKIVLQNVTALAAGQQIQHDPEGRPVTVGVLTVLASPEDAEKLIHAAGQGRIQLALRNMLDVAQVRTTGARVAGLLSGATGGRAAGPVRPTRVAPTTAEEPVRPLEVEIYRGGQRAVKRF